MSITIRDATTEDRETCLQLLQALSDFSGLGLRDGAAIAFDQLLDQKRGQVIVAERGDQVLGMASVSYNWAMRYGGEYCQLEELIVDPAGRGQNIGGLLVEATVKNARKRGCAEYGLYLVEHTEQNQPFYEKFGFVKVGSEMRQVL